MIGARAIVSRVGEQIEDCVAELDAWDGDPHVTESIDDLLRAARTSRKNEPDPPGAPGPLHVEIRPVPRPAELPRPTYPPAMPPPVPAKVILPVPPDRRRR